MSEEHANLGRRRFLVGGAAITLSGAACVAPAASAPEPAAATGSSYPSTRLANLSDLAVAEPKAIAYPDASSPGLLIKLGRIAEGGVGPDRDVVAFSTLCVHKGVPLVYDAADHTLNCPRHLSRYDCEKGGTEIWGHATQNLPQFKLRVDAQGDIYAEGVDELIYGRLSNVLAVS